jgi:hypothetical protein
MTHYSHFIRVNPDFFKISGPLIDGRDIRANFVYELALAGTTLRYVEDQE